MTAIYEYFLSGNWYDGSCHGTLPGRKYRKKTRCFFCCRSDGVFSRPILLPTQTLFLFMSLGPASLVVTVMRSPLRYPQVSYLCTHEKISGPSSQAFLWIALDIILCDNCTILNWWSENLTGKSGEVLRLAFPILVETNIMISLHYLTRSTA